MFKKYATFVSGRIIFKIENNKMVAVCNSKKFQLDRNAIA
jgi:hypothetical protein